MVSGLGWQMTRGCKEAIFVAPLIWVHGWTNHDDHQGVWEEVLGSWAEMKTGFQRPQESSGRSLVGTDSRSDGRLNLPAPSLIWLRTENQKSSGFSPLRPQLPVGPAFLALIMTRKEELTGKVLVTEALRESDHIISEILMAKKRSKPLLET